MQNNKQTDKKNRQKKQQTKNGKNKQTNKRTNIQTNKQINIRHTYWRTNRLIYKQTNRQTTSIHLCSCWEVYQYINQLLALDYLDLTQRGVAKVLDIEIY